MSRKGKIHLVESFSGPRSCYKNVTNDTKYTALKEAAEGLHKGKRVLNEATTINNMKKILTESKIDEAIHKAVLESLEQVGANIDEVELWQFPVSRVNTIEEPNFNGRVYNRQLWENVIHKQRDVWQGGTGLANHPGDNEDGDFMKQSIVWLDGFIGEDGLIYGIGTFVGEGGALARQIISVGGRIGFSTSGYGDFLRDKVTVDPDDYEIDRFADLVLGPSQGTYGDHKDIIVIEKTEKTGKLTESVDRMNEDDEKVVETEVEETEDKNVEDETTTTTENEENKEVESEEDELTLTEELVLNHYLEAVKDINKESNKLWEGKIENLKNLTKKIKKENLSVKSKEKLNAQITKLIENIMKDTRNAIQEGFEARKICEDLEISSISKLSNIKEKLEDFVALEECLNTTSKEVKKYKELYEAKTAYAVSEAENAYKVETELEESIKQNKTLRKNLVETKETVQGLKNRLIETEKASNELQVKLESTNRQHLEVRTKLSVLLLENKKLSKKNSDLKENIDKLNQDLERSSNLKEGLTKHQNILKKDYQGLLKENRRLQDLLNEAEKTIKVLKQSKRQMKEAEEQRRNDERAFRDTDSIQNYIDTMDLTDDFEGVKTTRELQNQLLFNSDVLDDVSEVTRSRIRRPKDSPESLADLFD